MTLNIPLFDGWRIRSDAHNIILGKIEGNRETESYYFSTIQGALESFLELKIRDFNSTSIFGLTQAIKTLQTRLNTLIQGFNLRVVEVSEAKIKGEKENGENKIY